MNSVTILVGGLAGLSAGVLAWRLVLRPAGYRREDETPRLQASRSVWTLPVFALAGSLAGILPGWWPLSAWVYLVGGVLLGWIDIDVHRIPDRITVLWGPALVVAITVATGMHGSWSALLGAGWGGLVFGAAALVMALVGTMGLGDVKLATITGLLLGALGWPTSVVHGGMAALAAGALIGIVLVLCGRAATTHMPFGPAIITGAAASITLQSLSLG